MEGTLNRLNLRTKTLNPTTYPQTLVRDYLIYIERVDHRPQTTVNNRKYTLLPFLRWLEKDDIRDITIFDIDDYLAARSDELKTTSVNAARQTFRSFFTHCMDYNEIPLQFDPRQIQRIKEIPPRVKTFTEEEIKRVITETRHIQDKLVIAVMYETGMRIGEIIDLAPYDIRGAQIQTRGKGQKDRVLYMTRDTAQALRHFMIMRGIVSGKVFRPLQAQRGYPSDSYVGTKGMRDRIERAFKRAGITMHPHQLRHSFAVNAILKGMDIRTLQILLGHEDLTTTQRYLKLADPSIERSYREYFVDSVLS